MKVNQSEAVLKKYLPQNVSHLTLSEATQAFCNFYLQERADKTVIENNDDMLLYEYGMYSWENGYFTANLTRQFCIGKAGVMSQLHLVLAYECTPEIKALPKQSSSQWCYTPDQLAEYREQQIEHSLAYQLLESASAHHVDVRFHKV